MKLDPVRKEQLNITAQGEIECLQIEIERLEFLLQQEKDAYGMNVIEILDAVQEGRMSKMKAHQRLNKYYKVKYQGNNYTKSEEK